MNKAIRVMIVDDHALFRSGLRLLLQTQSDIEVVGETGDGKEGIEIVAALKPDVVLMDLSMPGVAGLEATKEIRRIAPDVKVLVLTMHEDDAYLRPLFQAGACGYLLKRAADTALLEAIRAVANGGIYVDPGMAAGLLRQALGSTDEFRATGATRDSFLSPREEQILRLIAKGYTSQQVSEQSHISVKTVETHKARGMEKLGLRGRAALIRYALQKEWFER